MGEGDPIEETSMPLGFTPCITTGEGDPFQNTTGLAGEESVSL